MTKKVIAFVVLVLIFFASRTQMVQAFFDCLTLTISSAQADKDFCRNELAQIEAQLTDLLNKQKEQQKTTGTIKGDVDYLTSQINALKTKIKARALVIAQLKVNIQEKVNKIESLSDKIEREHESLAQLLRNTNEFDDETIVHLILSDASISNFYSDLESYASIKQAVKASADLIRGIKIETEVTDDQCSSYLNPQQSLATITITQTTQPTDSWPAESVETLDDFEHHRNLTLKATQKALKTMADTYLKSATSILEEK